MLGRLVTLLLAASAWLGLTLVDSKGEILPAYYSDNYVSCFRATGARSRSASPPALRRRRR
jgi:hypothetical protein